MKGRASLLFLFVVLFSPVCGQTDVRYGNVLEVPLIFSEINPESPVGIFSLDLPFYFPSDSRTRPRNKFSVGYSMGNVWLPQTRIYYPRNMSRQQEVAVARLNMTLRPQYFEDMDIETRQKVYGADGVLQHFRFMFLHSWKRNSLIMNMNLHALNGGKFPLNFFVSDTFIEWYHSTFAIADNYGRRLYPFNKAFFEFEDENGRVFRKDKGDVFTGVFDLHYYRDLIDYVGPKSHFYSQAGFHLSIPLNHFHSYVIPGLSAGARYDFMLGARSSFSVALSGGVTNQTFLKTGRGVHAIDRKYRKEAKLYFGINLISKKKKTTTIGILNNYQDALMKGADFKWNQTGYDKLGMRFLEEGDTWEGEPISQEFWLTKLTPASLYYFSWKTYLLAGFHKKGRSFTVYIGEDLFYLDNSPDFQIGFQYCFPLPFKK